MTQARFVVEVLPQDVSGGRLLSHLNRTVKASLDRIECVVERKQDFRVVPTLEQGVLSAVHAAGAYAEPWCVYVSPRYLQLVVNKLRPLRVNGALIVITRNRKPAALFLHWITVGDDLPLFVEEAVAGRLNELREEIVSETLSEREEALVLQFRHAIDQAYVGALGGDHSTCN